MTRGYRVPFRPGMTIYQALAETGAVRFNRFGQIVSVSGIPIGGGVNYQLQLNGRVIPQSLLGLPIQRNDNVGLVLFYALQREETDIVQEPQQ